MSVPVAHRAGPRLPDRLSAITDTAVAHQLRVGQLSEVEAAAIHALHLGFFGPPTVGGRESLLGPAATWRTGRRRYATRPRTPEQAGPTPVVPEPRLATGPLFGPTAPRTRITCGGPPAGARWIRRVRVLQATTRVGVAWSRRDVHRAHRAAIAEVDADRREARTVTVWQHHDGWHAAIHDDWGTTITDLTPHPTTLDEARAVANGAWAELHAAAAAQPWRWTPVHPTTDQASR